jgi:hypothetical protein
MKKEGKIGSVVRCCYWRRRDGRAALRALHSG